MIYLFKNDKTLNTDYPIIPEDVILSMPERRQINGLWTVSAELLVEGIYEHVNNSEFIGFYDIDDKFQLYKIIDLQVNNDVFIVDAVYLFHDEAYSGEVIRDRRFRDRQADVAAIAAFEPIGWELDGHDFTDEKTTSFYYISPLEALARIEEVWGVEFNFWLVFDGQKILGKYYEVRKQIGVRSNRIYEYNENISSVTHTQSRQDIVTAILPRGRGEELEEGTFGRSIQIDDVVWSKASGDPLDKPADQDYLEIPEMTSLWGYEGVKPRIRKVDFSQEEDPENLIQLAYEWLLENCVPKVIFKLSIDDGAGHKLGDIVGVSYKEINLTSYTRVFEVEHDHRTGTTTVEFGDVELKSDRRISAIRSDIERIESNNSRVVELQQQFNDAFDRKVQDMEQEYEQALIDAQAEIQAAEQRMADLIGQAREDFDTDFQDEIDRIEQEALAEYIRISGEITDSIDQARSEIEEDYNQAVTNAREYADTQIANKEQQYVEDWDIRDASIQSTIEQIVGGSVDSLTSNLSEINSGLLEINSKLLDKLEIEDISDLYADVDTITTNLNTARNDLDTARADLDTARADLDTTRDDLNSTRDDLQAKLDDAKAEFDNLEIGGRNLIKDSNTFTGRWVNFGDSVVSSEKESNGYTHVIVDTGSSHIAVMRLINELKAEYSGEELTLSFDLINHGEDLILVHNWSGGRDNNYIPTGYNQRFKVTGIYSESAAGQIQFRTHTNPPENGLDFSIRNLQVEIGNVATDWTPAPEDVETKITTLEQDIQYIDGELSAKLTQTDIEPFVNRISQAETDITASATNITLLQNKTTSIDGEIIRWGNLTQSTADEVTSVLSRVSDTESGLESAETAITNTADGLSALVTRTSDVEGRIESAETSIITEAGRIDTLVTRTSDVEDGIETAKTNITTQAGRIDTLVTRTSEVEDGIESAETRIATEAGRIDTVLSRTTTAEGKITAAESAIATTADGLSALITRTEATESGLTQAQTDISANADAITAKVWQQDIDGIEVGGRNLIRDSQESFKVEYSGSGELNKRYNVGSRITTPLTIDNEYTISLRARGNIDIRVFRISSTGNSSIRFVERNELSETEFRDFSMTFRPHRDELTAIYLTTGYSTGVSGWYEVDENSLKLEKGNKATDWTLAPEDTDAKITQLSTDINITADGLSALVTRTESTESGIFQLETDLSVEAGRITAVLSDISDIVGENLINEDSYIGDLGRQVNVNPNSNLSFSKGEYVIRLGNPDFYGTFEIRVSGNNNDLIPRQSFDDEMEFELEEDSNSFRIVVYTTVQDFFDADLQLVENTQSLLNLSQKLTITASELSTTMIRVGEAETAIGTIQASVDGFRSEVANIDTWHYNMLRGTRFDEDKWDAFYGEILTDEDVNYYRFNQNSTTATAPYVQINTPYQFKAGETYTLSWDFQSFGVTVFDYVWLIATVEDGGGNISIHPPNNHDESDLTVTLGAEYRRYWIRFTPSRDIEAYVRIGANLNNNPLGRSSFKLRLPYLTTTDRSQWLYHQLDNSQNMEEVVSRVSSLEQTSDSITSQVGVMHGLVEDIETWRLDRGTIIDQTADAISAKVWQSDIDDLEISARNLIPKSDIYNHTSEWNTWGAETTLTSSTNEQLDGYVWVYRNNATSGTQLGAITPILTKDLIAGIPYTIRFKTTHFRDTKSIMDYMYFMYENHSNQGIRYQDVDVKYFRTNAFSDEWIYQVTAIPSHSGPARIMFGTTGTRQDRGQISFYIKEPMVVEGTKVIGDYQPAPEDSLLITDFILRSDGFLLGGKYVGGEHYSTAIIGDANGLKLLGDTIIDGNLYVKETIESYALNTVEANIGSLFANTANINFIRAGHINTNAIGAKHLYVDSALINKLSASTIFTNMLSTKTLDAIDANIGTVRTSLLTANVITSGMIQSSNATINKLFSNNARIDTLVSKTHFVDEIHTMSLNAVHGDIANLRSELITANVITSDHIKVENALINKLFATSALIERLTTKTAFISSIKAIDIDVMKITGNTSNFVQSNWNSINSSLEVTGARLRYTHSDGSYTQMSAAGLRKFDNNSWYTTHYLMDSVNVTVNTGGATDVVWVQLPNVYKGKQFKIFLSATDIYGAVQEGDYYNNHLTLKRFVLIKSPDHNIDYTNARVPIRGYAHYVDDRDKSKNNIFYPLQGVLTVIY